MVSKLITIPSTVLMRATPSAPALATERATSAIFVTSGVSLASIGISPPITLRTPSTTRADVSQSVAKTSPRFSTFGQEILTSTAEIPGVDRILRARIEYSSMVSPAIETITRDPCESNHGTSLARNASIPGPCRPIELSIPDGVSAIRGVGRPCRGLFITDLVTTAPISFSGKNCANSFPLLAHPDAVKSGEGNQALPKVVDRSTSCAI